MGKRKLNMVISIGKFKEHSLLILNGNYVYEQVYVLGDLRGGTV